MIPSSRAMGMRSRAVVFALLLSACADRGKDASDAGVDVDRMRADALTVPGSRLPPRPEAIALAQQVEGLALKEGAGARAVELHVLAAKIHERVWRIEHREQDAKE